MKPKYNLTLWQRLGLWNLKLLWLLTPKEDRKTWHEVKKGMEKHEHKFTIPHKGIFLMCEHEGCTLCDLKDDLI